MYTIAQWERAKLGRSDVEFTEIYLKHGLVNVVIGTIKVPYATKKDAYRTKKVRWNQFGICLDENGLENSILTPYNIHLPQIR